MNRWPLPAVLTWLACWVVFRLALGQGFAVQWAMGLACALGVAASLAGATWWRRLLIAGGFPLSLALAVSTATGASVPAWGWLIPLALLLLVYPMNAWRDAPLFPTPRDALLGLPAEVELPEHANILDAGCGLGHGLRALRRAYPQVELHGMEWSWPLRLLCGGLCPWASVRRADIWESTWSTFDMVYLFQRPESMQRAWDKARRDMRPGTWLVSLEFEVQGVTPFARIALEGDRPVWVYRVPEQ